MTTLVIALVAWPISAFGAALLLCNARTVQRWLVYSGRAVTAFSLLWVGFVIVEALR